MLRGRIDGFPVRHKRPPTARVPRALQKEEDTGGGVSVLANEGTLRRGEDPTRNDYNIGLGSLAWRRLCSHQKINIAIQNVKKDKS